MEGFCYFASFQLSGLDQPGVCFPVDALKTDAVYDSCSRGIVRTPEYVNLAGNVWRMREKSVALASIDPPKDKQFVHSNAVSSKA